MIKNRKLRGLLEIVWANKLDGRKKHSKSMNGNNHGQINSTPTKL